MRRALLRSVFLLICHSIATAPAAVSRRNEVAPPSISRSQFGGGDECSCGPGGAAKSGRGPHKPECPTRQADWKICASPEKVSKTARVFVEEERTPQKRHKTVRMNVYDAMNFGDLLGLKGDARPDEGAPLIATLAYRQCDAVVVDKSRQRRIKNSLEGMLKRSQQRLERIKSGVKKGAAKAFTWVAKKFNCREGEDEKDRSVRVLGALGDTHERQERLRERDDGLRRDNREAASKAQPNGHWPPPCARGEVSPVQRLRHFFRELDGLGDRIEICSNCRQKNVAMGVGDGVGPKAEFCSFCCEHPETMHWNNSLDLNLSPDAQFGIDTNTSDAARAEFAELQKAWPQMSPIEEAMISPVCACFTVLSLPSGGQLGYRGNVINFPFDVAKIAAQLPRAAADCGVVVYRVRYKKRGKGPGDADRDVSKLERVRRGAVEGYLNFFMKHHKYFATGLTTKDGSVVFPPVVIDKAAIDELPENGVPDGLVYEYIDDECIDDDGPGADEHGDCMSDGCVYEDGQFAASS